MIDQFYRAFEDAHRGSWDSVTARLIVYRPVLEALRQAAMENIGGPTSVKGVQSVPGMAPHPLATRATPTRPAGSGTATPRPATAPTQRSN